MNKRCIKKVIKRFGTSFELRKKAANPFLEDFKKTIYELHYDDISFGKKQMREDLDRFGLDFKNATRDAQVKINQGEELIYQ